MPRCPGGTTEGLPAAGRISAVAPTPAGQFVNKLVKVIDRVFRCEFPSRSSSIWGKTVRTKSCRSTGNKTDVYRGHHGIGPFKDITAERFHAEVMRVLAGSIFLEMNEV